MSSEFQQMSLADICTDVSYGYTESATSEPVGPKFLRITDIQGGTFNWGKVPYCPATKADAKKYRLEVGDIVVARTGNSTGENAQVTSEPPDAVFASYLIRFRPDVSKVNPSFIGYQLRSERFRQHVSAVRGGSAQPGANAKQLGAFPIILIEREKQDAAVGILRVLDDRIALLRETNATLEVIAQALFKSWFVDFDPVHARARGEVSTGLSPETAALFPDSFEESELGMVPKGWGVVPLSDVMDFKEGPGIRNWQYTNSDGGTRFINIRCIQDGDLTIETANRISDDEANGKYAHFQLSPWDVVVSTSGTLGRSAIVREEHLPLILNTSVIRFRPVAGRTVFSFIYQYLNGVEFLYKLESMASGSVQKNFGPMHLKQIKLVCPPFPLLQSYEDLCRPLYEKIVANRVQAQTLANVRDTLLPRLISGQLRLPDIETEVDRAIQSPKNTSQQADAIHSGKAT